MNLLLVRLGLPRGDLQEDRERTCERSGRAIPEPGPLGELIARGVLDNLTFVVPR